MVVFWRLGYAKNVNIFVFVGLIVEKLDVFNIIDCFEKALVLFGKPMASGRKNVFVLRVFAIEVVVAKYDKGWGNFAKLREPGSKAP